jgi:hypothetical protein
MSMPNDTSHIAHTLRTNERTATPEPAARIQGIALVYGCMLVVDHQQGMPHLVNQAGSWSRLNCS